MQEKLRICCVSYKFSPFIGGAEVRAEKQARQLLACGEHVLLITLRLKKSWPSREVLQGLPIIRIGGLYNLKGSLRLGRWGHLASDIALFLTLWNLRHQYDIIQVFQLNTLSAAAVLIARLTKKPIVISTQNTGPDVDHFHHLTEHAYLLSGPLDHPVPHAIQKHDWIASSSEITALPYVAIGGRFLLHFLRKSQAYYQVLSTRGYKYLVAHGFRSDHIVHISGSVDSDKFHPNPLLRPDPDGRERDILCIARMDYGKGVDVLLYAWGHLIAQLKAQKSPLKPRLLLIGEGRFKAHMKQIVADLQLQQSVRFLGQRLDVLNLLQRSWGFALPSRWEGMPNALLEAMSCGLPCVATRVSGSEDLITHRVNGLLVEPETPQQLAQALYLLITDTDLAQQLGSQARQTILQRYQLRDTVSRLLKFYHTLLASQQK